MSISTSTPDEPLAIDISARERAEALAWLKDAADTLAVDETIAPYLNAAAVLSTFSLEGLRPAGAVGELDHTEAMIEMTNRARITGTGSWQLEEGARRAALRRLGNPAAMQAARAANPGSAADPVQEAIDLLTNSGTAAPKLENLTLDQLLALERATAWFEGIQISLPARADLAARIERERQLAPMRKIAGRGFVDREAFLAQLNDYVGVLPAENVFRSIWRGIKYVAYLMDKRPPLHLHGPGGMGKSALLARFILNHADPNSPQPLPFVYLDFDRAALDPKDPATLVTDAIRQLLVQFPNLDQDLLNLSDEAGESAGNFDSVDISRSTHFDSGDDLIRRFCRLLEVIAGKNDQPVLLVLDTLEEAQHQGESAMAVTWNLLRVLLSQVDRLRVVTAGRSELPVTLPRELLELKGLPPEAAAQLLRDRATTLTGQSLSQEEAASIVLLVGTVPLSLILAGRVVAAEGLEALRDTVRRPTLFAKIKEEQRQGMLYRRILNHVRAHHKELATLVDPGLILRRITPEIIEKVLAKPCGLLLQKSGDASILFEKLGREVGLVDPYREPGAVWHLLPVRQIMLPDLRKTLGCTAQAIHESAAQYYHELPNPSLIERAEEIYHRLWLGASSAHLDGLWLTHMDTSLRSAYEELEPVAKIWLAVKLGIELDEKLRSQADYATWERQAMQRAQTLMKSGLLEQALAAIRERPRPENSSPLDALEADALKLLGRIAEAKEVLEKGLAKAGAEGDGRALLPLTSRLAFLHETMGDFATALTHACRAIELAQMIDDSMDLLSGCVAVLRVRRKSGPNSKPAQDGTENGFFDKALPIARGLLKDPTVRRALVARPTLLREAAAELGTEDIDLLTSAISQLGISPSARLALIRLTSGARGALDPEQGRALINFGRGTSSRGQGRAIASLVPAFPSFFTEQLALTVEDSLHQTYAESTTTTRQSSSDAVLSGLQIKQLSEVIVKFFDESELSMLALDILDVPTSKLVPPPSLEEQILGLFKEAASRGAVRRLLTALVRSRQDNPSFYKQMVDILGWLHV